MTAIMETLPHRERAILQALIDRGGRTTQADPSTKHERLSRYLLVS